MHGLAIDRHVAIGGVRPDGVVLIDIGAGLGVLVNLHEGTKTKALDVQWAEHLFGPFQPFKPTDTFRSRIHHLLDEPGHVPVGHMAPDPALSLDEPPPYTRQELANMLEAANLQVDDYMPEQPTMATDENFMDTCTGQLVPQMQSAGVEVADAQVFCSALYLQRCGILPYGASTEASTPPAETAPPPPVEEPAPAPGDTADNMPPLYHEVPEERVDACGMDMPAGEMTPGAIGKPNKKKKAGLAADTVGKPNN